MGKAQSGITRLAALSAHWLGAPNSRIANWTASNTSKIQSQPPNDDPARTIPDAPLLPHTTARMASVQSVQCFGKKKTATAVAHCKQGQGLIKVNGQPLSLVEPQVLRFKVYEPVLLLGLDKFGTFARDEMGGKRIGRSLEGSWWRWKWRLEA